MKQIQVSKGTSKIITWTDEHPLLKAGNSNKFKGKDDWWDIEQVYDQQVDKAEINRSWHVGGL